MIWVWINAAARWLKFMFWPAENSPVYPKIDINAQCISCGHRQGKIQAWKNKEGKPVVAHNCGICGEVFLENPVVETSTKYVRAVTPKE